MSCGLGNNLPLDLCTFGGCPAKTRSYMPRNDKSNANNAGFYFVGYAKHFRRYKFYNSIIKTIFEIINSIFFEDVEFGGKRIIKSI